MFLSQYCSSHSPSKPLPSIQLLIRRHLSVILSSVLLYPFGAPIPRKQKQSLNMNLSCVQMLSSTPCPLALVRIKNLPVSRCFSSSAAKAKGDYSWFWFICGYKSPT